MRIPEYSGKSEWKGFWMQFKLLSDQFLLDPGRTTEPSCIKYKGGGGSFQLCSHLSPEVREHLPCLLVAMQQCFGDHILPETYRATLLTLKKSG